MAAKRVKSGGSGGVNKADGGCSPGLLEPSSPPAVAKRRGFAMTKRSPDHRGGRGFSFCDLAGYRCPLQTQLFIDAFQLRLDREDTGTLPREIAEHG